MAYGFVILIAWVAFFLVWAVSAFNVKRDIRRGSYFEIWMRHVALRLALLIILVAGFTWYGNRIPSSGNVVHVLVHELYTVTPVIGWTAAACALVGIAFAIWARVHLGRNWSSRPAMKEGHELVTSGPYEYVRHPIYTGILLALFGSALLGSPIGIFVFAVFLIVFVLRIGKEEGIMRALFPEAYPPYQARTKKLIPFIW